MNNRKKKILVLDNNGDNTGHIKQGLEYLYPAEYNVICVNCGKKFFEVLEKSHSIPDVILLDRSLLEMKGWEVLNFLKHNPQWKFIPIIFLGEKSDKVAKNFGNFFGDNFVEKPFEIKNLKAKIEQVLEQ